MKVYILYDTIEAPYGGANQFMRALKNYFRERNLLARSIISADVVLLNSHSLGGRHGTVFSVAYALKGIFPSKIFVHRVDGPIQRYGGSTRASVDKKIYLVNEAVVDGTIFQSDWSRVENKALGMQSTVYETTIHNAADPMFFSPAQNKTSADRIRLIAAAWSDHPNKGFDIYTTLDSQLDWSRFSMTFVGQSPVQFKNITMCEPVTSRELGDLFRQHDIFVTASKHDPCSNALLEAMACGLPAVVRSSGGHPELIGRGGEKFTDVASAVAALHKVADNLEVYQTRVPTVSMDTVGAAYRTFIQQISDDVQRNRYTPKRQSIPAAFIRMFR